MKSRSLLVVVEAASAQKMLEAFTMTKGSTVIWQAFNNKTAGPTNNWPYTVIYFQAPWKMSAQLLSGDNSTVNEFPN